MLGYTLFLAIVPLPDDAARIARDAATLRSVHGMRGEPLPPDRLHITLHTLAGFIDTIPQAVVDAARAAAADVICPLLPIVFDRALSFARCNAFALRCDASGDAAVARLRLPLSRAPRRVDVRPAPPTRHT